MTGRAGYAAAVLIALAVAGAPASAPAAYLPSGSVLAPHVPGQLLVRFRDDAATTTKSRLFEELGARDPLPVGRAGATLIRLSGVGVEQALLRLAGHPDVDFAEPNYLYRSAALPDDPQFHRQWGLSNQGQSSGTPGSDIHAPEAWETTTGSAAVLVAIIDTGVDYAHPDLVANVWNNPGEVPENGVDDDGNGYVDDVRGWDFANDDNDPMDDHFHGTHVAGIVGAVGNNGIGVAGVNWQVRLLPLKFLDDAGVGTTAAAIGAVDYAVAAGARILNNSWGGPGFSQALRLTIEQAEAAGALFVAASGNTLSGGRDNDVTPFFPASYPVPGIIAVAATDHDDLLAAFSNWGVVAVDLAAPGVDVYSTFPRGDYGYLNGTSMATPHVSGALALLMARFPGIEAPDAKALVLARADPVPALVGRTLTGGRLNAARLLNDPDDEAPGTVTDLEAANPDANRVDLSWTATGDDGTEGQASRYDLRFAPFPLDETSFSLAHRAIGLPKPGPPGSRDGTRVNGLAPATRYWFALQVLDEYGNRSALSNVVEIATLGPPVVSVDPERLEADLFTGEAAILPLRLGNAGAGELTWEIVVEGIAPTTKGGAKAAGPHHRHAATPAAGTSVAGVVPGALEPWGEQAVPAGAALVTREITDATAAAGTRFSYHEKDATGGHFKGLHREFGAVQPSYATFWVRPGSRLDNDGYFVLRDSTGTEVIFFYASAGGTFYVNADVGGNLDAPYESETWYHIEFRNIDYSTKRFDYYVDGRLIQAGIPFRFPGVRDVARLDLYSFDPGAESWWDEIALTSEPPIFPVVVQPTRGLLPSGGVADLAVTLDARGRVGGNHTAELILRSNDPARAEIRIPVLLRVTGAPDMALSATEIDFGGLFVGGVAVRELEIRNVGTDVLRVFDAVSDHPDFTAEFEPMEIAPGEGRSLGLRHAPRTEGAASAMLTLATDDPDEPRTVVMLRGTGLLPPEAVISPSALTATLQTGQARSFDLRLANTGFSDLHWEAGFPMEAEPALESVLYAFDRNHARVTDAIAAGYPFSGGVTGITINGGGDNMYNGGNFLSTDRGGSIPYSDGVIGTHAGLGDAGRYFTRKVPGLFLLAADLDGRPFFSIAGMLGSTTGGQVDGTVLTARANGRTFRAFVKRSHGGARPSVNHLLIVEDDPAVDHTFATALTDDYHVLYGLSGATRLYYLLWAGRSGRHYDDAATTRLIEAFFDALRLGPPWIEILPRSGTVAPGDARTASVTLDAFGLAGGTRSTMVRVSTNDPRAADTFVPVTLEVLAAPDIAVSPVSLDFGSPFVGTAATRQVAVRNVGAARLTVGPVEIEGPGFEGAANGFVLEPGENAMLGVAFRPSEPGAASGMLRIFSDDPDEGQVTVSLGAQGILPPVMRVNPERLEYDIRSGDVVVRTLRIDNLAGANLSFVVEVRAHAVAGASTPEQQDAPGATPAHGRSAADLALAPALAPPVKSTPIGEPADGTPAPFVFRDDFEDGVLDGWSGVGVQNGGSAEKTAGDPRQVASRTPTAEAGPGGVTGPVPTQLGDALRVRPALGMLPAGGSIAIEVTLDGERLVDGVHEGQILVRGNDPVRPEVVVPVLVRVTGEPLIATSTSRLEFGAVPLGLAQTRGLTVINAGTATLNVTEVRATPAEFIAGGTVFSLPPGASRSVNVTFRPTVTGTLAGSLTLINDSRTPEHTVTLGGTGVDAAQLQVEPEELVQVQFRGETVTRTLRLRNAGGQPLTWALIARATATGSALRTVPVFSDDIENETADWTAEAYGADSLWWRDPQRFRSASHGWSCTIQDGETYDTGRRVGAAVISPPIDLRKAAAPIRLRFQETHETEPGRDQCMVDVRADRGGPWSPLRGGYGSAPSGNSGGWVSETLDLTAWAGEIVRLRFYFVGSSRVDLQACKLEYSIVSPK